ncbi:MAG: TetR/AcrR family transcriptional regulator, partial [Euryarchaeota archaeon]|nr:TetR/AcrR family transcriptional regulator [Euryarchaeota archaeon]
MKSSPVGTTQQVTSTRDRVLSAALEVFGRKGFNGATTREIARQAGVNEVTLFRYFGSKEALFASVIEERSPLVQIRRTISIDADTSIDDLLIHNVKAVLEALRANKHLYMVLLGDAWRIPKTRAMINDLAIQRGMSLVSGFIEAQMEVGRLR